MTTFAVATLTLLPGKDRGTQAATKGAGGSASGTVKVQFNPTSLRIQRQVSQRRGGVSRKDQQVQYSSARAATLTFDLEFDTAEDATTNAAGSTQLVDVRTRIAPIRDLVEPPGRAPASAPNRVQFAWGTFAFQGVVTQITEELDYFAFDGTPLRAKLSMTIEEQNPKYAALEKGSGARTDRAATGPGGQVPDLQLPEVEENPPGAAPGHKGTRDPLMRMDAREGESVQQLAARIGGDPGAWRSLMNELTSPVGLAAGTPVVVGPELDTPAALGGALGFAAGVTASPVQGLAAALGLVAQSAAGSPLERFAPPVSGVAAGFALSAAGGLEAATRVVLAAETSEAVQAERASFAVPARPAVPGGPARVEAVDPRLLSYGRAVPLRTRVHAQTAEDARTGGRRSLAARALPAEITVSGAPGIAPWTRLPPAATGRAASDAAQRGRDARATTMRGRRGGGCR